MKKPYLIAGLGTMALVAIFITYLYMGKAFEAKPWEPEKPYPYKSEDVTFENKPAKVKLAGTLTLPSETGKFPAVILITGSGPQNRDEEILGHKPFLILADHLTRNGIAVLRYDDRGTASSTGDFQSATGVDFSMDAESALAYLKTRSDIDTTRIGLIGHSEGGMVATLVAARRADVAFMVLLASPAVNILKGLVTQDSLIARSFGVSEKEVEEMKKVNRQVYELAASDISNDSLKSQLTILAKNNELKLPGQLIPPGVTKEQMMEANIQRFSSPWFRYIIDYDPAVDLAKIKCPVLALIGEKDLQVTPWDNLPLTQSILKNAGNTNVVAKELKNLNHFFQECETGSPKEYADTSQMFASTMLSEISAWLNIRIK
ncbi:alpha/beta hydrolase [Dyadobacter luteus]|uniref:Alpha/beta hydrolase n=1 Tax=Dyadobacter luteus TaxID=2259619 RepID=A0A3D8YCJ2_9BACT|nr:alpha/beta fold hydrolase [Dyadobacter luteus]REA61553.1 alpha/beta hydrolase [Dyadobacter luteus]